jgi:UDP-N-acetylglucosamine 1-carboxyvinyltransferase
MEKYVIKGGQRLEGEVTIAGAKNAALGILAASILTDEECIIENVPFVEDTKVLLRAIENLGATVKYIDGHTVSICAGTIKDDGYLAVDDEYIRKIRASYYLLGSLLGKFSYAKVALPGGCEIGLRPIDQHIKGFRALGAEVDIVDSSVYAKAEKLNGNHIYMDVVTVGATINIMLAAVLAEGKTTIENAAKEPHIVDVANFLNSMGANIKGAG